MDELDNVNGAPEDAAKEAPAQEPKPQEPRPTESKEYNFNTMTIEGMLEVHNEMVITLTDLGFAGSDIAPRKSFRTKGDALFSCQRLHAAIAAAINEDREKAQAILAANWRTIGTLVPGIGTEQAKLPEPAPKETVEKAKRARKSKTETETQESDVSTATAKKGSKKSTAAKAAKPAKEAKAKTPKAPKVAKPKPNGIAFSPRNENYETSKISILVEGNPKREGSHQYETWKFYREGMTVKAFLAKFDDRKEGVNRLHFDQVRGFVKIVQA